MFRCCRVLHYCVRLENACVNKESKHTHWSMQFFLQDPVSWLQLLEAINGIHERITRHNICRNLDGRSVKRFVPNQPSSRASASTHSTSWLVSSIIRERRVRSNRLCRILQSFCLWPRGSWRVGQWLVFDLALQVFQRLGIKPTIHESCSKEEQSPQLQPSDWFHRCYLSIPLTVLSSYYL